jgi:(1->4)-alpha-D-glucan 1-alpha-D-glucosylmutase
MAEVTSTYRLQLRPAGEHGFGFDDAAAVAPYLAELGVSHAYTSPLLESAPSSQHGYDVAAPDRVRTEYGGEAGFQRYCAALQRLGLGLVIDIVPNHMSIVTARNRWWWDVLRQGVASPYAPYFDLDWGADEKILLPWLARPLPATLAAGELRLDTQDGAPALLYGGMALPLAPGTEQGPLLQVLERQHYRLVHWSLADRRLSYRRFFDISSLIGVRIEDPAVFAATHQRILDWLQAGCVDGLRIDHIDGLRDPGGYLEQLRTAAAPATWIVVEKILTHGEPLRPSWPVAGTTGYEFLNLVMGLFVDPRSEEDMDAAYAAFAGPQPEFREVAHHARMQAMRDLLHAEVRRLGPMAVAAGMARDGGEAESALGAVAAAMPAYRTYVPPAGAAGAEDAAIVIEAVQAAGLQPSFYEALLAPQQRGLLLQFQQLTPAVFAKGVEDTAFYRYHRLTALNEVGGDPARFGTEPEEFHFAMGIAQRLRPRRMLTTSTHDTKRGEDVRARLCLLTEIPEAWRAAALAWRQHNRRHHRDAGPDGNTEYLLYQTLVGAWPISAERLQTFMLKAVREAKVHTSWRKPNGRYERALTAFITALYADAEFLRLAQAFIEPLITPGYVNALAQAAVKMTAPGVPDIYNGAELWDFHLVDPDNRGPVDFAARRHLLQELQAGLTPEAIWARREEGLPKLWLIYQALQLRRERPQAFAAAGGAGGTIGAAGGAGSTFGAAGGAGSYDALATDGRWADHVLAYTRGGEVATVAPRQVLTIQDWVRTSVDLPPGRWRDRLTGAVVSGSVPVQDLWARFPVALLAREVGA